MPYLNHGLPIGVDKAIFAFTTGNKHPYSVTMTNDYIGLNSEGKKAVPGGLFVTEVGNGNTYRFLPRATVTQAITTSLDYFKMTPFNIFVPGDVLYILEPYVTLTVTAASATQTQTLTLDGRTATSIAPSNVPSEVAAQIAADFNRAPYVSDRLYFTATGAVVYISSKDNTLPTISEGGTVTATLSGTTLAVNTTPIGTIKTINAETGVVYLEAVGGVAVPVGMRIGVPVNKVLGLHSHAIDFTNAPSKDIAVCNESRGVRIQFLPYYDADLANRLPQITFDTRF